MRNGVPDDQTINILFEAIANSLLCRELAPPDTGITPLCAGSIGS